MGELLLWGGDDSPTPGEPGCLPGEVSLGGVVLITFCLAQQIHSEIPVVLEPKHGRS